MSTELEPFQYTDTLGDQGEQVELLISEAFRNRLHLQDNNIGVILKKAREKQGHTVRLLAKECGVTSSYISKVENGKKKPSATVFSNICSRLEISGDEGESLNRLRILKLRQYKDKDMNDILDLCNELLKRPKTVATKVAITSLIKSCMERYVNNYPKQDVYSTKASHNSSKDNVSLELIKSKHIFAFIQVYKNSFDHVYKDKSMLYMVNLFCKRVIITTSEFNSFSWSQFFLPCNEKKGEYRDVRDKDALFYPLITPFENKLKELNINFSETDINKVFDESITNIGFVLLAGVYNSYSHKNWYENY